MHKNPIWLGFLAIAACIVLWFIGTALYRYYQFSILTEQTRTVHVEWSVDKKSEEEFVLRGKYRYVAMGKEYQGETSFPHQYYRNAWGAEKAVSFFASKYDKVWYSQNNPQHSSLQKSFPLKECITAGILLALLIYFLGLGRYAARYQHEERSK